MKTHGDNIVLKTQELVENAPTSTFIVDEICKKLGIGRRTFERRFKKSTSNSFTEYIQRVKIEFAKKDLEVGRKTVNEIIYEDGYNDVDAFRKVFKKFTDLTPVAYRKNLRYNTNQLSDPRYYASHGEFVPYYWRLRKLT